MDINVILDVVLVTMETPLTTLVNFVNWIVRPVLITKHVKAANPDIIIIIKHVCKLVLLDTFRTPMVKIARIVRQIANRVLIVQIIVYLVTQDLHFICKLENVYRNVQLVNIQTSHQALVNSATQPASIVANTVFA